MITKYDIDEQVKFGGEDLVVCGIMIDDHCNTTYKLKSIDDKYIRYLDESEIHTDDELNSKREYTDLNMWSFSGNSELL